MPQRVYQAIEALETADAGEIATAVRTSDIAAVNSALQVLEEIGSVRPSLSRPGAYRTQPPDSALSRVLEGAVARLRNEAAQLAASADLAADLRRIHAAAGDDAAPSDHEHLIGLDAILRRLTELTHSARHSVDSLLPTTPAQSGLDASLVDDLPMLRRGVRLRSLFPDSARSVPYMAAYAARAQELGAQIRTAHTVAVRIVIYDKTTAVVTAKLDNDKPSAVVVRTEGVVLALSAMFALLWDRGANLLDGTDLSTLEHSILRALHGGTTDDAIGRSLGVSTRTVRRVIARLCDRAEATSRFALGAEAVRRGWLSLS